MKTMGNSTKNLSGCTYMICKLYFTMQEWKHSYWFDYSWSYTTI